MSYTDKEIVNILIEEGLVFEAYGKRYVDPKGFDLLLKVKNSDHRVLKRIKSNDLDTPLQILVKYMKEKLKEKKYN